MKKTTFKLNLALLKKLSLKNSGQVTVEYILLSVTLLVLFQISTNILQESDSLKNFQETPQKIFKNMVENGNFEPNEDESRKQHPNHFEFQHTPNARDM